MHSTITVVGGSGFIGSNLINILRKNCSIFNLDKAPSRMMETTICDICDVESLRKSMQTSEWLVLLAAEHKDNVQPVERYYDVNVKGTQNVLNVMREKHIQKIIFTSTVAVYGLNKQNPDESYPVDPFNHYGQSKFQAEEILRAWYHEDPENRTLIILRPTVVFGPKNRGNVYHLLNQILKGNFKMIGKGENKKSMSYVENLVAFMHYLVMNKVSHYALFNYVDKPDLSTKELVETIYTATKRKNSSIYIPYTVGYLAGLTFDVLRFITRKEFSISSVRIKKFCATTQFSDKKLSETSFKPPYTLKQGLAITIASLMEELP